MSKPNRGWPINKTPRLDSKPLQGEISLARAAELAAGDPAGSQSFGLLSAGVIIPPTTFPAMVAQFFVINNS
jgi:hypothetical protein